MTRFVPGSSLLLLVVCCLFWLFFETKAQSENACLCYLPYFTDGKKVRPEFSVPTNNENIMLEKGRAFVLHLHFVVVRRNRCQDYCFGRKVMRCCVIQLFLEQQCWDDLYRCHKQNNNTINPTPFDGVSRHSLHIAQTAWHLAELRFLGPEKLVGPELDMQGKYPGCTQYHSVH